MFAHVSIGPRTYFFKMLIFVDRCNFWAKINIEKLASETAVYSILSIWSLALLTFGVDVPLKCAKGFFTSSKYKHVQFFSLLDSLATDLVKL